MERRQIFIAAVLTIIAGGAVIAFALVYTPPHPEGFTRPPAPPADFSAEVLLIHPPSGAILYAAALNVRGLASAPARFRVELIVEDAIIAEAIVETLAGEWALELAHGYDGQPTEALIRVVPVEADGEYDSTLVMLSPLAERPEGAFGSVANPVMGADVGGDSILLEGRASGVPGNALHITLNDDSGTPINTTTVFLLNPYFVDDIPFRIAITTNGYTGPATINVYFAPEPDADALHTQIAVNIGAAAG